MSYWPIIWYFTHARTHTRLWLAIKRNGHDGESNREGNFRWPQNWRTV